MSDLVEVGVDKTMAAHGKADGRASLASLVKPTLGAVAPIERARARAAPVKGEDSTATLSTDALIIERLRIAEPVLIDRANAAARGRFATLVSKRLCAGITDAVKNVHSIIGAVAKSLDPEQGRALQDLALTIRFRTETVLPQTVMSMTPSQLVAVLADACEAHAPGGIDSLRCREIVYGRNSPLAREAMLDIAWSGPVHAGQGLDRLVAASLIDTFAATGVLKAATIATLRQRCLDAAVSEDARPSARTRLDGDPSPVEVLRAAIADGSETAPALLASAAGLPVEAVRAAILLRSPEAMVSIAWRAGLEASVSVSIQTTMARVPPDEILHPTQTGRYPLAEAAMLWQCRLFARDRGLRG